MKRNIHEPVEEAWITKLCMASSSEVFRFWDVGAAIGYYTVLVAKLRKNVLITAFEPLARHADAIGEHLALNGVDPAQVVTKRAAVFSHDGSLPFVDEGFGSVVSDTDQAGSERVAATTIAMEIRQVESRIDLVKVDVQGREVDVLAGMGRNPEQICTWVVGTHSAEIHVACEAILLDRGYELLFSASDVDGQPDGLIVATMLPPEATERA